MRRRLRIHGLVTGVGYRAWFLRQAVRLGLNGWVRNADADTVEAVVEGTDEAVRHITTLSKTGPEDAQVTGIESVPEPAEAALSGFSIRL